MALRGRAAASRPDWEVAVPGRQQRPRDRPADWARQTAPCFRLETRRKGELHIRRMERGEESEACRLVCEVFREFVAPFYTQEGIDEFLRYAAPDRMAKRAGANHFTLIAEYDGDLVGVIEVRDFNHISLLFVAGAYQRKGIGRRLLHEATEIIKRKDANRVQVTVHSSPNAVAAYERFGFHVEAPEKSERGIRYVPMRVVLTKGDDAWPFPHPGAARIA
jgi:GNAT superfamily N-acetyltransferase